MDIDEQITYNHLFLSERECRTCGETKNLIDGFYLTRKERGTLPSAYSYECKVCTTRRVIQNRKKQRVFTDWLYPDWELFMHSFPSEKVKNNKYFQIN